MCKVSLARAALRHRIQGMQRRQRSKHSWLLTLGMATALAGCEGGQTGDNGSSGGECAEVSRQQLSAAEADARGYDASQAIAELTAGRTEQGETVWLTGPPSLWLDAGTTPPPDRSLPAQLFVKTTTIEEAVHECTTSDVRHRMLEVGVELRLETEDPPGVLTGRGSMTLSEATPSIGDVSATVGIDAFEHQNYCQLRPRATEGLELDCEYIWASSACLEPTARSLQPSVPRTPLSLDELVARANSVSPLSLQCEDGRSASAAFELLVPGSSCEKESGATPATLSVAIAELELPKDHRSARLTINSEAQCLQRGCGFSGLCLATVTEEQFDAGDNCAVVTVNTRAPQDDSGLTTHMTIQVDTDERKLVELVVVGPPDDDGRSLHCRGWSDL
jgi:hypothetical protein